jgi:sterol desaturase/sphingolipid hydroxylase (fatty acid hydroxylase superfamily)
MHTLEHLVYLSSVLIHIVVASHPIHILFHMHWNTLGAAITHTGFDSLTVNSKPVFMLGSFHHQLHHRYYHCNYGNSFMPWDKWFGSDHDGTAGAMAAIKRRRKS